MATEHRLSRSLFLSFFLQGLGVACVLPAGHRPAVLWSEKLWGCKDRCTRVQSLRQTPGSKPPTLNTKEPQPASRPHLRALPLSLSLLLASLQGIWGRGCRPPFPFAATLRRSGLLSPRVLAPSLPLPLFLSAGLWARRLPPLPARQSAPPTCAGGSLGR